MPNEPGEPSGGVLVPRVSARPVMRVDADGEQLASTPTLNEPRYPQSLERGLAILCCFTPELITAADRISARLGYRRADE
jgi:hypothetical protein